MSTLTTVFSVLCSRKSLRRLSMLCGWQMLRKIRVNTTHFAEMPSLQLPTTTNASTMGEAQDDEEFDDDNNNDDCIPNSRENRPSTLQSPRGLTLKIWSHSKHQGPQETEGLSIVMGSSLLPDGDEKTRPMRV